MYKNNESKVIKNGAQKSLVTCELINSLYEMKHWPLTDPEQFLPEHLIVGGHFYRSFLFLK